jgi:hypothetical protein
MVSYNFGDKFVNEVAVGDGMEIFERLCGFLLRNEGDKIILERS